MLHLRFGIANPITQSNPTANLHLGSIAQVGFSISQRYQYQYSVIIREWTNQESWLLTPDSLESFFRWESESRVTIQDSRVRSQLKSPSENLENFEHFLLIYLVNEALKCWKWSSYSKRYLNMVKVVNKVKDELEKLPHFTVSYGIKIGSDRESWLELESSNLSQGRESESEYWNKVTRPFPTGRGRGARND